MRKKKKKINRNLTMIYAGLFCLILIVCGIVYQTTRPKDSVSQIIEFYFLENTTSTMKTEPREVSGDTNADLLSSALAELKKGPKVEGLVGLIPEKVLFESANLDNGIATIHINSAYSDMKSGEELLCRASIVWTLTGLDFVSQVRITVGGEELKKTNGEPIGPMSRKDIVIDAVISPEPTNSETVKLYFSDQDAMQLVIEEREIQVNPNVPLEKYVMEQLIVGPKTSDLYATVPSETKIRDIKTVDGICYVDLSSEFVTKHSGGSTGEGLTVYSIVNSLTELSNIKKVQFLIEGEKVEEYKGHLDFSKPFDRSLDIVSESP